jgi:hypothetical protein
MRPLGPVLGRLSAVGAALLPFAGLAQDGGLSVVFGIENRLEVSRNPELAVPGTGTEVANVTVLSFGLLSETALDRLELNASGALIVENSEDTSGTEADFGRGTLDFAYQREVPAAIFQIAGLFRSDDIDAFADDLGDADEGGTRTDYGLSSRLEIGRTSSVGFEIGAAYDATDYRDETDPDLSDSKEVRGDIAAIFYFSEIATGRVGLRFLKRDVEDAGTTHTDTVGAFTGLDYAVSERLDLGVLLGYSDTETEEFGIIERTRGPDASISLTYDMPVGTALALLRVTTDVDEGQRETFEIGRNLETPLDRIEFRLGITHADVTGTDLIGGLTWDRDLPDGSLGLNIERRVAFDSDDDETVTDSIFSLRWTKDVTPVSAISLDTSYELSEAPSERIEQVTLGATYVHQLTEDWGLSGGVGYQVRRDADGRSESPSAFVALSRTFEFRP